MNQSIREAIVKILKDNESIFEYEDEVADQILSLLHSTLKKRIEGEKAGLPEPGEMMPPDPGQAADESRYAAFSKAQQIIDEILK